MSVQEIAEAKFDECLEAGMTRDEIIIAMVQADDNISLNMAQNVYKDKAKLAGISKARVGHKPQALEHIAASGVDILDEQARLALKSELATTFEVSNGTAHDYIRAYAVQEGIELNLGGPIGQGSEEIYEFIVANPGMDKPVFREFMESMGRSKGNIDETWRGVILARKLIASGAWANVDLSAVA